MKKIFGWTMVAVMSLGGVAACSSDAAKPSVTTATKTTTVAGGSTVAGGASANVEAFCKQADDLAVKLKAVIADPSSADAASVSAAAAKLATDGAALINSEPSDSARIQECIKHLTDVATPGG